jgi:periplasmic divalent cation tolerance protein
MVRVIFCTVGDEAAATRIAEALVTEWHAACVNIVPGVRSVYRWKGEVQRDGEHLLVIKTAVDRVDDLLVRLKELHPYEVPEMLVLDVERGWPPYLAWLVDATRD